MDLWPIGKEKQKLSMHISWLVSSMQTQNSKMEVISKVKWPISGSENIRKDVLDYTIGPTSYFP